MSTFLDQFERVKRFLRRIEDQDRDSVAYDDDLWAFFQNCYHLKDWIRNDPSIGDGIGGDVEDFVNGDKDLRICADLANRSKHLALDREPREDAKITNRNVTIIVTPVGADFAGTSTCEHVITLRDGSKHIALDVAKRAVEAWERFLSERELV